MSKEYRVSTDTLRAIFHAHTNDSDEWDACSIAEDIWALVSDAEGKR